MIDLNNVVTNLRKNGFIAEVFSDRASLVTAILEKLAHSKSISRGGSVTLDQLGIPDAIRAKGLPFRGNATYEDRLAALSADHFLTGTNAITEEGYLVNVDGTGSRIAAISFGPKQVFVVCGTNKIVKNVKAGFERIRAIAAPKTSALIKRNTPCLSFGRCMNSNSPDCICRKRHVTLRGEEGRVSVFLINEPLGF
ncbi:MAG: lactate utilization protein [Deltaproteobacteria bacterium]|nr:lactate utilization protein [Deltaproteobacteria bacterium]